MLDPPDGPIVLRQARWKLLLAVIGCLAFCAVALWIIAEARRDRLDPWPGILLGGGGFAVFFAFAGLGLVGLVRPVTLTIDAAGIRYVAPFKRGERPWSAVSGFRIARMRGTRMVVYDDASPPSPRLASINRDLVGADAALPTALTIRPEALLELVVAAKARWG